MPRPIAGQDPAECQIARQFIQYTRVARNVFGSALLLGKLRKKTSDWALDPAFIGHNADFSLWLRELPEDMQIIYPQDGSAPWIPSHQIANMHSYHCLSIVMHFRPQLHAVSDSYDGIWKQHMITCYTAAKNLCKLQEAILKTYGMPGLLCMLRGISFHIYCVLTCTMLHLVCNPFTLHALLANTVRLPLLALIQLSMVKPESSLFATCAFWKHAPRPSPCPKCSSR